MDIEKEKLIRQLACSEEFEELEKRAKGALIFFVGALLLTIVALFSL